MRQELNSEAGWRGASGRFLSCLLAALLALLPHLARSQVTPADGAQKKAPVPPESVQESVLAVVKSVFKDDYAHRGTAERRALAAKLYQRAAETSDDAASRFVLLCEARDQAAATADVALMMKAINALVGGYQMPAGDEMQMELAALTKARNAVGSDDAPLLYDAATSAASHAMELDDYDAAAKFVEVALSCSDKVHESGAFADARLLAREVQVRRAEFERIEKANEVLARNPDDPFANAAAGKFLCLLKGDWERGLPMLAKGADGPLKAVARHDAMKPAESADQTKVADAWWAASSALTAPYKQPAQARAYKWYNDALVGAKGLARDKINLRLTQVEAAMGPRHGRHVVNLLGVIDPVRDAVAGKWAIQGGSLLSDGTSAARIAIPYQPPEEYDFIVEFTQPKSNTAVVQVLSEKETSFVWAIMGAAGSAAFGDVDRKGGPPAPLAAELDAPLQPGHRYTSVVRVRRDGISAFLDDKLVNQRATNFSDLHMEKYWQLPQPMLGVGSEASPTVFSRIEVVEIRGPGRMLHR